MYAVAAIPCCRYPAPGPAEATSASATTRRKKAAYSFARPTKTTFSVALAVARPAAVRVRRELSERRAGEGQRNPPFVPLRPWRVTLRSPALHTGVIRPTVDTRAA